MADLGGIHDDFLFNWHLRVLDSSLSWEAAQSSHLARVWLE